MYEKLRLQSKAIIRKSNYYYCLEDSLDKQTQLSFIISSLDTCSRFQWSNIVFQQQFMITCNFLKIKNKKFYIQNKNDVVDLHDVVLYACRQGVSKNLGGPKFRWSLTKKLIWTVSWNITDQIFNYNSTTMLY